MGTFRWEEEIGHIAASGWDLSGLLFICIVGYLGYNIDKNLPSLFDKILDNFKRLLITTTLIGGVVGVLLSGTGGLLTGLIVGAVCFWVTFIYVTFATALLKILLD